MKTSRFQLYFADWSEEPESRILFGQVRSLFLTFDLPEGQRSLIIQNKPSIENQNSLRATVQTSSWVTGSSAVLKWLFFSVDDWIKAFLPVTSPLFVSSVLLSRAAAKTPPEAAAVAPEPWPSPDLLITWPRWCHCTEVIAFHSLNTSVLHSCQRLHSRLLWSNTKKKKRSDPEQYLFQKN